MNETDKAARDLFNLPEGTKEERHAAYLGNCAALMAARTQRDQHEYKRVDTHQMEALVWTALLLGIGGGLLATVVTIMWNA